MKNKFISILILLVTIALMVSLAACNSSSEDTDTITSADVTVPSDEALSTTASEISSAEIITDSDLTQNSEFIPAVTQDNNETVILTNPVVNSGDDTPVLNTDVSTEKPQITKSESIQMTEPTFPFEEEIELPFVPIQ